ncbi:MAG: Gfo/Idh/MocA family oxidoreductase [Planctomycetota bacterium]
MQRSAVVVGTGFIGPIHVEALRRAGVRVAGVVGSSPEKSRRAAEQLGIPDGIETLDDALSRDDVDCVHIASPNRLHFSQALAVLEAGKHVVCEKPLAMNSDETATLVSLAKSRGLSAAVAYNIRFYPLCHEAAARVASGSIGEFLHVQGSYVQDWLLRRSDFNWRVLAADGGELRAVADIGTHWLDLIQFVTGKKIVSVCADLRTVYPERDRPVGNVETFSSGSSSKSPTEPIKITTEDCGAVMLRFEGGANGTLWVSQTTAGRKNCLRFEVAGSEQSISFDSQQPNSLEIGHRDRANQTLLRDPSLMEPSAASIASYPGGHNEGFNDTFKQLFRSFYRSLDQAESASGALYPTFADGHREVLLCEAILQSHRERRWVDVRNEGSAIR